MKKALFVLRTWLALSILVSLAACRLGSVSVQEETIRIALKDELYEEYFDYHSHWNDFFNYDHVFYWTDGELPLGLEVTGSGRLLGIAHETGSFDFEVSVYGYDFDGYEEYLDSGWFTVFVTEPSTNENCPSPDAYNVNELYLCLGHESEEAVETDDIVTLDLNYYVDPELAFSYAVGSLTFNISYDKDAFTLNEELLNSGVLREAATIEDSYVGFEINRPGVLTVSLDSGTSRGLVRSGRLMNIPFVVLKDLDQESYDFEVNVLQVTSNKGVGLPDTVSLDGQLDVDEPAVEEEAASQSSGPPLGALDYPSDNEAKNADNAGDGSI